MRLEFYEEWLSPKGLRDGRMGLAPLQAVLSFLRQEGELYEPVVERAGELAAGWWLAELPSVRRAVTTSGPFWLRGRLALGLCQDLIRQTFRDSHVTVVWAAGQGQVTLGTCVFCDVREPVAHRLCGFYVSAITAVMGAVGLSSTVEVSTCRATGGAACVLRVTPEVP